MSATTKRISASHTEKENQTAKAFGQRVAQIRERQKISILALAEMTGLSKYVIEQIIKGKRYTQSSKEMSALANAFQMTTGRLKGDDTLETKQHLDEIIKSKSGYESALDLIDELQGKSVCLNDDLDVLYYRGRVLRGLNRIEEAENVVKLAFDLMVAELTDEKLEADDERFIRACNEMIQFYYYTDQPDQVVQFVTSVNKSGYFTGKPLQQATMSNYLGFCAHAQKKYDVSIGYFRDAATLYTAAGQIHEAGRAEANIGTIMYLTGNVHDANEYFKKALANQQHDQPYNQCVTLKEYGRALIKSGASSRAMETIDLALEMIESNMLNFPTLKAKLLMMKGHQKSETAYLEEALLANDLPIHLLINLHDLLTVLYLNDGNLEKARFHHSACVDILKACNDYEDYREGEWF